LPKEPDVLLKADPLAEIIEPATIMHRDELEVILIPYVSAPK